MNVLTLNIKELSVNPNNPREIRADKFDKLIESILTFPRMLALREIVVDRGAETVALGGNMRYRALSVIADMPTDQIKNIIAGSRKYKDRTAYEVEQLVSYWETWKADPVIEVKDGSNLSEAEKKEFVIKDNVSYGDWDTDDLANNWDELDLQDWNVDVWPAQSEEEENEAAEEELESASEAYEVVVSCKNEADQMLLMTELEERGYKCKSKSV